MPERIIEIKSRKLQLMKPITAADYASRTVLTDSVWEYVELWLRREKSEKSKKALFYWNQARNFYCASECLETESKPLTEYYCCLNATKALLVINGKSSVDFDKISHGISSDRKKWKTTNIKDATVIFNGKGVLFELSKHLGEEACKKEIGIYDLLYNIPCIHRTFSLTYNCSELFIPIRKVYFTANSSIKKGWVQFEIDESYSNGNSLRYLPMNYEKISKCNDCFIYRSKKRFDWDIHLDKKDRIKELSDYQFKIRKDIHYIAGKTKLWYLKKDIPNNKRIIDRNSLSLIFAVMHWLSELVRYNPEKFHTLMKSKQNWLIQEFINNALHQFIDEISCEMTHVDIMERGYRK